MASLGWPVWHFNLCGGGCEWISDQIPCMTHLTQICFLWLAPLRGSIGSINHHGANDSPRGLSIFFPLALFYKLRLWAASNGLNKKCRCKTVGSFWLITKFNALQVAWTILNSWEVLCFFFWSLDHWRVKIIGEELTLFVMFIVCQVQLNQHGCRFSGAQAKRSLAWIDWIGQDTKEGQQLVG